MPILGIVFGQLMDDLNSATCEAADSTLSQRNELRANVNDKVLTVVYIAIANLVLIYVYIVSWNLFGERLAQRVREHYLKSMLRKDVDYFDKVSPGEMANNLDADVNAIKEATSQKVGIVINAVSFFVTAYTIAFIKNARLGGILVSLTPAFLLMSLVGGHFIGKYAMAMSKAVASASNITFEALSNMTIVQAFGANERLADRLAAILSSSKSAGIRKAFTASIQAGLLFFIAYSANATAYYVGSRDIASAVENGGGTTVGTIYTVIFILVDATIILSMVAPFLQLFGAGQAAFVKLETNATSSTDAAATRALPKTGVDLSSIEFKHVSFAYPSRPESEVLESVSFSIASGQNVAVVGPSGSGKSSLANLILRLYASTKGAVLVGGEDISAFDATTLRGFMSCVQQEATIFDRSVLENISLGLVNSPKHQHLRQTLLSGALAEVAHQIREGTDPFQAAKHDPRCSEIVDLVFQAAEQADADTFIQRLRHGYGTVVGAKGALVSGGQRQRIAFARALVKDPEILILDEATASLDSISEQRIHEALKKGQRHRTTLTIAHRLSSIKDADNIIVLQSGQIVEQATHFELMASKGLYSELVSLQQNSRQSSQEQVSSLTTFKDAIDENKTMISAEVQGSEVVETDATESSKKAEASSDPDIGVRRPLPFVLRMLAPMLRPSAAMLVIALTAMLIVGGTYSASALILGNTIGELSPCNDADDIRRAGAFFALMFFVLAIIELFANMISWSGFGLASEGLLVLIRLRTFRSLLTQDQGWHESAERTPKSLLSLFTADCNAIGGLTGSTVGTILSIMVNIIAAIILTHIVAWKIALVCLSLVPLIMGSGAMHLISLARFAVKHSQAFKTSIGIAVEAVESIKTVAALSLEEEVLETYRRSLKKPTKEMTQQSLYSYMWLALAYGLPTFLFALSFWWGSSLVLTGEYTQVDYYICTVALLVSAQLWGQLFTIAPDVSKAFQAVRRIVNLFSLSSTDQLASDLERKMIVEKRLLPQNEGGASLSIQGLRFAYPSRPQSQVLKDFSLKVEPGQFCALVGPSGQGKSTVFALIERMYRPEAGQIWLDGNEITRGDHSFRDRLSYVPQDSVMFDGSIRFNLELGASSEQTVTQKDLEEACRLANIHEKVASLPDGFDSDVGAGGSQLSGGEKQRLAVARALVRKPKLLLLDESTSALDPQSEKALERGLQDARAATGMTVIAIAHRLSTIKNADVIFVVDGGRVIDSGRHEELLARCETYRINATHQGF
jgi:ATP-binding cassette, subfamily B (MDR/TAP), member 1